MESFILDCIRNAKLEHNLKPSMSGNVTDGYSSRRHLESKARYIPVIKLYCNLYMKWNATSKIRFASGMVVI